MIGHEFKPDSDWTICHKVNSQFVSVLTFKELAFVDGLGWRDVATDCLAFESDSQSEVINAALSAARDDSRTSSFRVYETWIIEKPVRLVGKRDNRRIG